MSSFDKILEDNLSVYEGRHDDIINQAPEFYRLLTRILDDPRLPGRLRPMVLVGIAYFILPNDVIPEDIYGPYGYLDDIFLSAYIANDIKQEMGLDDILIANWGGEADVITLIEDILSNEHDLIGDKGKQILWYVGYEHIKRHKNQG